MKRWFSQGLDQGQGGGDNSRQVQAAGNVYISEGMQPDAVYRLCRDLIRSEFDRFSREARASIDERITEFQENYLVRQAQRAPESVASLQRPIMQRAIRSAQIEYGTSGDPDLGRVLVDLVVDLSSNHPRSIYAISLMDAVVAAPKLTAAEMNALTVVYGLVHRSYDWPTPAKMYDDLRKFIVPFTGDLPEDSIDYRHMQGAGVCWLEFDRTERLANLFRDGYPGHFSIPPIQYLRTDYAGTDFTEGGAWYPAHTPIPPVEDNSQFSHIIVGGETHTNTIYDRRRNDRLRTEIPEAVTSREGRMAMDTALVKNLMSVEAVEKELIGNVPELEPLFDVWKRTNLRDIEMTTPGMVIAHANLRAKATGAPTAAF